MISGGFDIHISIDRGSGFLVLFVERNKFDRRLWDCCQIIAQILLETPMPTEN